MRKNNNAHMHKQAQKRKLKLAQKRKAKQMQLRSSKQKAFAMSMASALTATSGAALAQDGGTMEEVVVTGIRGALTAAMDIKRDGQGVVDAISAEDIGKFPDTNLAESLQRISGVSIDRSNGEGQFVTVRGLGPSFNLVTLNGRQMPTADIEDTSAGSSRNFDFSNLASEAVAGLEVFKTGRADMPTGGMGATVNIKTTRPLEAGSLGSVGVKLMNDSSNVNGEDYTPEISAIFSETYFDGTFGVAVSASMQERHSRLNSSEASSGWYSTRDSETGGADWGTLPGDITGPTDPVNGNPITNRPSADDLYQSARNLMHRFNDIERTRTNYQLTLQYAPTDTITTTLDYTYSELDTETHRQEFSTWFNQPDALPAPFGDGIADGVVQPSTYSDGPVSSPLIYADNSCCDIGMGVGEYGVINENRSLGFNVEWQTTDNLSLELDVHNSVAKSGAPDRRGSNNIVTAAQYAPARSLTIVDYRNDLPLVTIGFGGNAPDPDSPALHPSNFVSAGTSIRNSFMRSEIEQTQIKGQYTFDDGFLKSVDFGVQITDATVRMAYSNAQRDAWGGFGTPDNYSDHLFTERNLVEQFDSVDGSGAVITGEPWQAFINANVGEQYQQQVYYDVDFTQFVAQIDALPLGGFAPLTLNCAGGIGLIACDWQVDRTVNEEITAFYAQANMEFDLGGMASHLSVGVRNESTDISSSGVVPIYTSLIWAADNEFTPVSTGNGSLVREGEYDHTLPNIDFDIEITDNIVARASFSQTLARPNYQDIQGGVTIDSIVRINGGTGNGGNPDLLPFESENLDVSVEWYYGDSSYISAGFFDKEVENFIATANQQEAVFPDLTHPGQGPRYQQALIDYPGPTQAVREGMADQYGGNFNGIFEPGIDMPVAGDATDPVVIFDLIVPVNSDTKTVDGFEIAWQHAFDNGFGVVVNYTDVSTDAEYDRSVTNKLPNAVNQTPLIGVSDSYNVVGFYEDDSWQVRLAYNWRDEFLTATVDGNGQPNPIFTTEYEQLDLNASYNVTEDFSVFFEGINLTDEYVRTISRTDHATVGVFVTGPRYNIGARYNFK